MIEGEFCDENMPGLFRLLYYFDLYNWLLVCYIVIKKSYLLDRERKMIQMGYVFRLFFVLFFLSL